jgi:glycerate kinase
MALGAVPVPGFELLREFSRLDERLTGAALAVTGEGQLSAQTLLGKLPARLAALAKTHGARTVAVVGAVASDWRGADSPFDRVLPLCTGGVTPEYSMTHAAALVRRALLEREL